MMPKGSAEAVDFEFEDAEIDLEAVLAAPASDDVPPDPQPDRSGGEKKTSRRRVRVSKAVRDQVRDSVAVMMDLPVSFVLGNDDHCLGAYNEAADDIHDRVTAIVCKHPDWVEKITAGPDWLDWLLLFRALSGPVRAVVEHHVFKADETAEDGPIDLAKYRAPHAV